MAPSIFGEIRERAINAARREEGRLSPAKIREAIDLLASLHEDERFHVLGVFCAGCGGVATMKHGECANTACPVGTERRSPSDCVNVRQEWFDRITKFDLARHGGDQP